MLEILRTIAPIFLVILLGMGLKRWGLLPAGFLGPANRLVYYVSIPAMIFRQIAPASFTDHFNPAVVAGTLIPIFVALAVGWALGRGIGLKQGRAGTFNQGGFHGNLGYIGLAVAYYYLGDTGLTRASIISGFMMLQQNLQAVFVYSVHHTPAEGAASPMDLGKGFWMRKIVLHPVILSAMAGMAASILEIPIPIILSRGLDILGGLALPLALLLIGAGLSLSQLRGQAGLALLSSSIKLVLLPLVGLGAYLLLGVEAEDYLPGLVLLAAPSATMVYVLAMEMGGDPDLGTAIVSIGTLISAVTYTVWLGFLV